MPILEKWEDFMPSKRTFPVFLGIIFMVNAAVLWAGDSASYVDLGFSPDGSIYMFSQYGVKSGVLRPWADLFIVDVARNDFVPEGRISYTHDKPIEAGQDGAGALYRVMTKNSGLIERYGLNYPNQGQPLYIALSGDPAYEGKGITFRDFTSGISYRADLVETVNGSGKTARSSFYITLQSVDVDGEVKNYKVGTPHLERPAVFSYRIKKVLVAPSGNSLIFVIEMKRYAENGPDIRYMVEALRF
jgi:predicted secreted protein